jgi:hypothetical protein
VNRALNSGQLKRASVGQSRLFGQIMEQLGPLSAAAACLWHGQFMSRGRTCEAIGELFGIPVSPGAVTAMVQRDRREARRHAGGNPRGAGRRRGDPGVRRHPGPR